MELCFYIICSGPVIIYCPSFKINTISFTFSWIFTTTGLVWWILLFILEVIYLQKLEFFLAVLPLVVSCFYQEYYIARN